MPDIYFATSGRTPSKEEESALVVPELKQRGVDARMANWDDPDVDWGAAKLCVIRSTWDYHTRPEQFLDWLKRVSTETSLWNPLEVIRWNIHKRYLLELAKRDVPVVPTVAVAAGGNLSLGQIRDQEGWTDTVIKPAISIGAMGTFRAAEQDPAGEKEFASLVNAGDVLVQPFVSSIVTEGEVSLVFIDGQFAHAAIKKPGEGDFRVQTQHGGSYARFDATPEIVEVGERILGAVDQQLLYARVDLARFEGQYHLMELELIEPRLFFTQNPDSIDTFCDALVRRLAG